MFPGFKTELLMIGSPKLFILVKFSLTNLSDSSNSQTYVKGSIFHIFVVGVLLFWFLILGWK